MDDIGLTLLNTVLLGTSVRLLRGDALDALIVVVLGRGTLLGLHALCGEHHVSLLLCAAM